MLNLLIVLLPYLFAFIYFVATYTKTHSLRSAIVSTVILGLVGLWIIPFVLGFLSPLFGSASYGFLFLLGIPLLGGVMFFIAYKFKVLWLWNSPQANTPQVPSNSKLKTPGTILVVVGLILSLSPFVTGSFIPFAALNPFIYTAVMVPLGLVVLFVGFYLRGK